MESFFKGKRVLVAGASGFIGLHLSKELLRLGASVTGTYFRRTNFEKIVGVEYVEADLTNYDHCLKVSDRVDFVFMAAANTSGAAVIEKTPLAHLTPNVVMNALTLAAAYENNVKKFCFISSNTVYPVTDHDVREKDVNYDFFSKYFVVGWMKLFSEKMCEMYSRHISDPMKTLTVRPGNIYGPHDKFTWSESKVIAALIRRAVERQDPFVVWGDGSDLKEFIYIEDFIDALLKAFVTFDDGEPINISSSKPITIREVLDMILNIENMSSIEVQYDETKPTMIPKRLINTDKLRAAINWEPRFSMEEGLRETINWYKKYYADVNPEQKYDN